MKTFEEIENNIQTLAKEMETSIDMLLDCICRFSEYSNSLEKSNELNLYLENSKPLTEIQNKIEKLRDVLNGINQ